MFDSRLALRLSDDGRAVIALAGPAGGAVSPEMVHALVDREGFGDYFLVQPAIEQFCRQVAAGTGPVSAVVAERRDGEVIVTVTNDGEAAYLTLVPPYGGKPHTRADILAALDKAGVKAGILQDVIDRAARLINADKILIAQALPGVPGEPARFVPLVEAGSFVPCDTPLMRRVPPTNGTPGEAVTGQPLPPPPGLDRDWGTLAGCAPSTTNSNLLVATQDGIVHFADAGAVVQPSCQIEVTVSPDGFGAFISFVPTPGGRSPTRTQLERALAKAGVTAGVLEDALTQASTLPAINNFLIAQAQMPQAGTPAQFLPLVPDDTWVEKSTPVMRLLPPGPPKPGCRVTGETLPAPQPASPPPFLPGEGTTVDARQPELLRATHAGRVRFHEHGAYVVRACHVTVQVAPDGLVAYLSLREGTGDAERQRPIIEEALAEAGVTTGILAEALDEAAAAPEVSGLLVARGRKPTRGEGGRVELLVDPQAKLVQAGTPLIRRIPARTGDPGVTVHGEVLPALEPPEAPDVSQRPGTVPSPEDPNTLVAAVAGQVLIGENWVEVVGITQYDTVTAETPVESEESIVITGSVETGGSVKSKGDVVVMGDVTGAEVEADGSIEIHGLISGNARVKAKGPIKVGEVRDASLESDGGITVTDAIAGAQISAAGPVAAGSISGGRVSSMEGVSADVIGSADGEPTTIDVGPTPAWQMKLNKAKAASAEVKAKIDEASRGLIHLKIKGRDHAHPNTMRLLELQRARLVEQGDALKLDEDRLVDAMQGKGPGQVVARELVHPGVKLTFTHLAQSLHLVREIENPVPGAVFSVRANQIIAVPSVRESIRPTELPVKQVLPPNA